MSLTKFAGISQRKVAFSIRSILDQLCLVFKYYATTLGLVYEIKVLNILNNVFFLFIVCGLMLSS